MATFPFFFLILALARDVWLRFLCFTVLDDSRKPCNQVFLPPVSSDSSSLISPSSHLFSPFSPRPLLPFPFRESFPLRVPAFLFVTFTFQHGTTPHFPIDVD